MNVNAAFLVKGRTDEGGFGGEPHAVGRHRHGVPFHTVLGELSDDVLDFRLHRVDAQIQGGGAGTRFTHCAAFVCAELLHEPVVNPLRHFILDVRGGAGHVGFEKLREHFGVALGDFLRYRPFPILQRQRQKRGNARCPRRFHGLHAEGDSRQMSQAVENGFRENRAVAASETGVTLKERLHKDVRRAVQLQNHRKGARQFVRDETRDAYFPGFQFHHTVLARRTLAARVVTAAVVFLVLTLFRRPLAFRHPGGFRLRAFHAHRGKRHVFGGFLLFRHVFSIFTS